MAYSDWGFKAPPFQTTSLPASEIGERLLVGRNKEIGQLISRIESVPKLSTIEGLNGVGKTSVVNVASYKMYRDHIEGGKGALYIPCRKIFQLDPTRDIQDFIQSVLMEVAQTLIERIQQVKNSGKLVWTQEVDRWLNSPQLVSYSAGVWVVQGGAQRETNTGAGYEQSGFRKAVTTWLETIFPTPESGGVICTIDNLELLQSSDAARDMLERLRDELFNIPGIRWVLCGSLGIIYGVVSSPRLEGYLHKPIEISEIGDSHAVEILKSRIDAYAGSAYYIPLLPVHFEALYNILRGNLRSVLSYADDYCQWVMDRKQPGTDGEKEVYFQEWLSEQSGSAFTAVRQELRPKAMEVFGRACEKIVFSPSDHNDFGFNSIPAFRPHIRDLESVGLLVSTQDEGDKRRKTIQVTPKGWMVKHHLDAMGG
jgi:hypothetical protein